MKKIVFSDFDGTLTYNEGLGPIFFDILSLLQKKKLPLVIVTGRSLSWGHFFLTHFPYLTDVIVEGGGAIVSREGKFITEELLVSNEEVDRLAEVAKKIKEKFPGVPLSVDSFGRKTDRAFELHDLLKSQDGLLFSHIEEFLKAENVNFSTSNVHLNFWCGELSKFKAVSHFLKKKNLKESDGVFFGDSLNDESMFKSFRDSVGVANISKVIDRLKYKPSVVLQGEDNVGPWGVLNFLKNLKPKVLFLCTGNSCRSQMAEGWARYYWGELYEFYSAGIEKHGMNPSAIEVMKESGIDLSNQYSKQLDELKMTFDLVITVCGHAQENCPVFSNPETEVVHVGFDDPPTLAMNLTNQEDKLKIYRRVRDEIGQFIKSYFGTF